MKKYLVLAALIVSFAAPAFAETIDVAFDRASHKCTMMHGQPAAPVINMGSYSFTSGGQGGYGQDEGMHGLEKTNRTVITRRLLVGRHFLRFKSMSNRADRVSAKSRSKRQHEWAMARPCGSWPTCVWNNPVCGR